MESLVNEKDLRIIEQVLVEMNLNQTDGSPQPQQSLPMPAHLGLKKAVFRT